MADIIRAVNGGKTTKKYIEEVMQDNIGLFARSDSTRVGYIGMLLTLCAGALVNLCS